MSKSGKAAVPLGIKFLVMVKMLVMVFWVMTPYDLVGGYQLSGGMYYHMKLDVIHSCETLVTMYKVS
jgi:hypothetical protein